MSRARVLALTIAAAVLAPAAAHAAEESTLRAQIPIGTDNAGRAWFLGGFSGLAPIGKSGKEYWTLTDRGPNDDADREHADDTGVYCANKPSGKVIFLPQFNPQIVKLGVRKGEVDVQERIALHDGAHAVSGKPNLTFDENTYLQTDPAAKTCTKLPDSGGVIDPFGVDTEGVVVDPRDGSFWLADEYRPSLIRVAPDGQLLSRLVPQDLGAIDAATKYASAVAAAGGSLAVQPVFPGIVNAFRKNRGFEGVAISPDGKTLYTLLQSPLDYQSLGVSSANRNKARLSPYIRVFKVDISDPAAPVLQAEWIYLLSRGFSGAAVPDKISDVQWLADDVLLIQERDDERPTLVTHHFRADFRNATNVLSGPAAAIASKTTVPTLEMTTAVPPEITPAATALAIDLDDWLFDAGFVTSKIEGTAIVRAHGKHPALFAALNDNDFNLDHTAGLAAAAIPTKLELF